MALSSLDTDVETDCCLDSSDTDLSPSTGYGTLSNMGIVWKEPTFSTQSFGVVSRGNRSKSAAWTNQEHANGNSANESQPLVFQSVCSTSGPVPPRIIEAGQKISDEMIEDGAHIVFDWDNTLKLYNKQTHQLSCRVSKEFLLHLKQDRHCKLYIISAIRPSALNLATLLSEVEKLGLTDIFVRDSRGDQVDGTAAATDNAVVKSEYAHMGNVIICGYDKAETFLMLSGFDSRRGEKVIFFDDEVVNINNFSALVPSSKCYFCK